MRAVIQRVSRATVRVDEATVGSIGTGLLVLVAVARDDTEEDLKFLVRKLLSLRCFPDEEDRLNLSVSDVEGELLMVSQFTLYGDCRKGTRPSFSRSAGREQGEEFFDRLISRLQESGLRVQSGRFGAMMDVELVNDGPVTLIVDSKKEFY